MRNNADFQNQILVHRGFSSTASPDEIQFDRLGHHWTTDRKVAESFAIQDTDWAEEGHPLEGTVLSAMVHKKHVMSAEEIPTHLEVLENGAEKEQTLRKGAPVKIVDATTLSMNVGDTKIKRGKPTLSRTEGRA
jgi:hypothetical protein